jgi:hypothetical protein
MTALEMLVAIALLGGLAFFIDFLWRQVKSAFAFLKLIDRWTDA